MHRNDKWRIWCTLHNGGSEIEFQFQNWIKIEGENLGQFFAFHLTLRAGSQFSRSDRICSWALVSFCLHHLLEPLKAHHFSQVDNDAILIALLKVKVILRLRQSTTVTDHPLSAFWNLRAAAEKFWALMMCVYSKFFSRRADQLDHFLFNQRAKWRKTKGFHFLCLKKIWPVAVQCTWKMSLGFFHCSTLLEKRKLLMHVIELPWSLIFNENQAKNNSKSYLV